MNWPLVPSVGVLALVPDSWFELWQPRHHVLSRLARYFHVVWVNPAPEWRDSLKRQTPKSILRSQAGQAPGFVVYSPEFWLPKLYRPRWVAQFAYRLRLKRAKNLLTRRGCQTFVLYLWRPEFEEALTAQPFDLICYHLDDEYSFSAIEVPISDVEARLLALVDQVFVHSKGLLEKKGKINPHTTLVPNGVDFQLYATPLREPTDLASIPRPRIGYTGVIKRQLDWDLLLYLTGRHPQWSFVFVGPLALHPEVKLATDELSRRRNVFFLGPKSALELAAYPQHFDVCLMPYRKDGYTKFIYPLKLHEYLASGSPIVGTQIRSLEEFAHVVALSGTSEEWSGAITEALDRAANTPDQRAARQAVAQQHDWNSIVQRIAKTIARRLGEKCSEQLEEALKSQSMLGGLQRTARAGEPAIP